MGKKTDPKKRVKKLKKENTKLANENFELRNIIKEIQKKSEKIVEDNKKEQAVMSALPKIKVEGRQK